MRLNGVLVSALLLFGCFPAAQSGPPSAPAQPRQLPAWRRPCAAYATGPVTFEYQDAPGGAAILYRAPGSESGLRERAHEVARFHNGSGAKNGILHDLSSVPHRTDVVDIDGGVKIVLRAKSVRTTDLDRLRWSVQQDVQMKQKDGCGSGQEAL